MNEEMSYNADVLNASAFYTIFFINSIKIDQPKYFTILVRE